MEKEGAEAAGPVQTTISMPRLLAVASSKRETTADDDIFYESATRVRSFGKKKGIVHRSFDASFSILNDCARCLDRRHPAIRIILLLYLLVCLLDFDFDRERDKQQTTTHSEICSSCNLFLCEIEAKDCSIARFASVELSSYRKSARKIRKKKR